MEIKFYELYGAFGFELKISSWVALMFSHSHLKSMSPGEQGIIRSALEATVAHFLEEG